MSRCVGKTAKGTPCTKRTKAGYCHLHRPTVINTNTSNKTNKKVPEIKPEIIIDIHDEAYVIGECSICLCDVEQDDDCLLVCVINIMQHVLNKC